MSNGTCITHFSKSANCSLHQIVRVGRTFRLCQTVLNTNALQNGAHCTTSHNTGTGRGGFDEYFSTSKLCNLLMRNSTIQYGNLNQVFLCSFYALCNSSGYFPCFTKAPTNDTILITHNNNCRECESSTTFRNLCNAIDSNQLILQLNIACTFNFNCHNL